MSDDELELLKRTVHDLCGVTLRLQVDMAGKPDLRDQFAIASLGNINVPYFDPILIAKRAYEIADAMMEARE